VATRSIRQSMRLPTLARFGAVLLLVLLAYHFFDQLAHVFLIGYAAAIVAVAINLIVRKLPLERRWVVAGIGALLVGLVVAATWFGGPLLMQQMRSVAQRGPEFEQQLQALTARIRSATGLNVGPLNEHAVQALRNLFGGGDVLGQARGLIGMLLLPLLVVFGGLFAAANPNDRLLIPVLRAVPRNRRAAVRRVFDLLGERLSSWIQGQLIAMAAVGTLVTIVLLLLRVPYALLLGLLNACTEFIPLAGPWMGGLPAVAIAALDHPMKGVWTALALFGVQMTEANLITPFTMSKVAKVHPFVTLFALFLFGSLFGFLGMLLALPLVMLLWTLFQVFWIEGAIDTDRDRIPPVVDE
jgi:predicted PurR-regulated permease PerM